MNELTTNELQEIHDNIKESRNQLDLQIFEGILEALKKCPDDSKSLDALVYFTKYLKCLNT